MRKTSKILTITCAFFFMNSVQASSVTICASTQTYSALEAIKTHSPIDYKVQYAFAEDLEALVSDPKSPCQLIISSDEKLPILLVRSGKALISDMQKIARAPLILWSADPHLLDEKASVVAKKQLKSLAIPKAELTPVGYAAAQIATRHNFPTNYLKGHIYRAEHEYQVLAMVQGGNVQTGFLSKPLILDNNGKAMGSYWQTPRHLYPELAYYLIPIQSEKNKSEIQKLWNYLKTSKAVMQDFIAAGFDSPMTQNK